MSAAYKIEKDVPLPRGRPSIYPYAQLAVGESFLVNDPDRAITAKNAAYSHGKRHGKKFTSETQPCGGIRIWRLK